MQTNNVKFNNQILASKLLTMKALSDNQTKNKESTEQKTIISLPKPIIINNREKSLNYLAPIFSFLSLVGVGYLIFTNRSNQKNIQGMDKKIDKLGSTFKNVASEMQQHNKRLDNLGFTVKTVAAETKNNSEITRQIKGAVDYTCGKIDHIAYLAEKVNQDISAGFNRIIERLGSKIEDVQGMLYKSRAVEQGMKNKVKQLCKTK